MALPTDKNSAKDSNPDPLTGAPGAHPIGVGVGAAGAGATGAAIGTAVAGPVGTVVGAVVGAVAGGLMGKGVAESVNPSAEDAHWRQNHGAQPFAKNRPYEDFAPAYRTGYTGYATHGKDGARFEDAEPHLRRDYEASLAGAGTTAAHAADRATDNVANAADRAGDNLAHAADRTGDAISHGASEVAHGTRVAWDEAKHAAKAAWNRVENAVEPETRR